MKPTSLLCLLLVMFLTLVTEGCVGNGGIVQNGGYWRATPEVDVVTLSDTGSTLVGLYIQGQGMTVGENHRVSVWFDALTSTGDPTVWGK